MREVPSTARQQDVEFFAKNGFLGPFKVYEPEEARDILKEVRIKNQDLSKALYDNQVNYDRHFDISELSQHIGHPEIVSRLRAIIGPDILCWRTEFFSKIPGSKATEWHQVEVYQFSTGIPMLMPTQRCENTPVELTVWTTFTESTKENGCIKFLPGSHKKLYYEESKAVKTGRGELYDWAKTETSFFGYNYSEFKVDPNWEPDEKQAVALEMQAGECVIFTAKCVHGSYPNTTKRSTRFAVGTRYVPTHVKVYSEHSQFIVHGGFFDIKNHGCVLVSGVDQYKHNQLRSTNNIGEPFPHIE